MIKKAWLNIEIEVDTNNHNIIRVIEILHET